MDFIPVSEPKLNGNEKKYLIHCIESGWISSEGPYVKEFEEKFSNYIGCSYGIAVSSGTAALETALYALNIEKESEVIMPSFTIISCAIACIRLGIKPVLVDIDPTTWTMDVHAVESKITSKTKAIMPVHIYGHSVDMDPLLKIRDQYGIPIIEDSAEAHGAEYFSEYKGNRWLKCGSIGDVSITSFYANKTITTGEGGMVLSSNPAIIERAKSYRNLCFDPQRRFSHSDIGYNFRMTNMQAALGLAQIEQIDHFIENKRTLAQYYSKKLESIHNLRFMDTMSWAKSVYWTYSVELNEQSKFDTFTLMEKLKNKKIGTRPFFKGMHSQESLKPYIKNNNDPFPNTDHAYKYGFYLPSGNTLTQENIDYIVSTLESELN